MVEESTGLLDCKVKVVYEDGNNHFSIKTGLITFENNSELILDGKVWISKSRIVRVEVIQ